MVILFVNIIIFIIDVKLIRRWFNEYFSDSFSL